MFLSSNSHSDLHGVVMHGSFRPMSSARHTLRHMQSVAVQYANVLPLSLPGILRVCEWLFHMHVAVLASSLGARPWGPCWGTRGRGKAKCVFVHQSSQRQTREHQLVFS